MRMGLGDEPVETPVRVRSGPSTPLTVSRPASAGSQPTPLIYGVLVLPLVGLLLWAFAAFNTTRLEKESKSASRPIFSQLRPATVNDINPALQGYLSLRHKAPVRLALEPYRGKVALSIYVNNKLLRRRRLLYGDLNRDSILNDYHERTGDQADTVSLRYRGGKPYLFIYTESDMEGF